MASASPSARRFSDPHETKTSVPEGLTIRGAVTGSESVELLGTLEGPLTTEGFCHIHETGSLRGRGRVRQRGNFYCGKQASDRHDRRFCGRSGKTDSGVGQRFGSQRFRQEECSCRSFRSGAAG